MSAQPKEVKKNEENTYYSTNRPQTESVRKSKVNLNDLVSRLKVEKKKDENKITPINVMAPKFSIAGARKRQV